MAMMINVHQVGAAMINSRAAMLVDAETGQVLYQQNAAQQLPVASVSKLLTACVIEDEITAHQLHWQQKVKINKAVAAVSSDPNYSAIGLKAGQSYTVRDLFDAMMVKSADGAALALSTAAGDSIKQFNTKMVKKARQIGLKDVKVVNAVGLRNGDLKQLQQPKLGKDTENAMSVRDVAALTLYLLKHYPQILKVTSRAQQNFTIARGQVVTADNSNQMLPGKPYAVPNVVIDGLKTGTSDQAGACFVSTGTYQGHRMITVVLGANQNVPGDRFVQTQRLYQYLQTGVRLKKLTLSCQQTYQKVVKGNKRHVTVKAAPLVVWQPVHDYQPLKLHLHYRTSLLDRHGQLVAPITKGQRLGKVIVSGKESQTVDHQQLTLTLTSRQTVKRLNLWQRLFN
ncbi:serine hydrolase [uncultured Limosilactobacillus sp.]|uniref:D-alanyl-D-alanine carboxypeptidase family protein n=1 Tax=uncultured Limosilactobacillus sp. TaxID=2837629 RepID=UPI0025D2E8D2|nr:serine hydrolase [uncultured Limosilactobacillus sp.]